MEQDSPRWVEVTRSQFAHEREGLAILRNALPGTGPFRAWSNFEFRDAHGKWSEVDLLVLGRRRLHLVELKYYRGRIRGDDLRWRRDGSRAEDSALKLTRRKAQRLASRLQDELAALARENNERPPKGRDVIPFVQEAVFLHHPDLRCELPPRSRIDLFGLDGAEARMGLPGISGRLLEQPAGGGSISPDQEQKLVALLARIGLVRQRRREVGSWVIDEEPLGEGDGWQDWPAFHRVVTSDRARVRFFVGPPGAATSEVVRRQQLVAHEFRIMKRLANDHLLTPCDVIDDELGPGLVYRHDQRFQRLDLWLADQPDGVPAATQLSVLRQVAEAVGYAHRHGVVHRGLTPAAVRVRVRDGGSPLVRVGDWQTAGATGAGTVTSGRITSLPEATGTGSGSAGRLAAALRPGIDLDQQFAEVFQAPEGVWKRDADRVRLDVFSLGALAYYLLSGRPPAPGRTGLRERLQRDHGLDLAADLPQVSSDLRALVLAATRPAVSDRLGDVAAFLTGLAKAEKELAAPEDLLTADPLEAPPGTVLDGRFTLEGRLGAGSTAVGLLVKDSAAGEAPRVLKVAVDDAAARRLEAEAEVLRPLRDRRLVRLLEGPLSVGDRRALLLEHAGDETLAAVLRERGRLSLDLLERWGTDLLDALVALDKAGVDHRDIKPANLGVRRSRGGAAGDRAKHLVLFDFSLARAGATTVDAGTPPYLDPFLPARGTYDSAAERYAAAVVLFEMATGAPPAYGDGQSDPATLTAEAAVTEDRFDPSVAPAFVAFFRAALARDAQARHDTAADMRAAWQAIFAPVPRAVPEDAEERAEVASAGTPLAEAGLSAWALSALEPYGVVTVGDLAALDPVRLNVLSGVAEATRKEVKERARRWREQFAGEARGTRTTAPAGGDLPDPVTAAGLLHDRAGSARSKTRRRAAAMLLGLEGGLDPFAVQGEVGEALGLTRARGGQLVSELQDAWAADEQARELLDAVAGVVRETVVELGGVAVVAELAEGVLAHLSPSDDDRAARLAAGLVRAALDRLDALTRAEGLDRAVQLVSRRRAGRVALLATDPLLLEAAQAAARQADALVEAAGRAGEPLVPRQRAAAALQEAAAMVAPEAPGLTGERLVRLAGRQDRRAAVSGHGELYDRELPPATAVARTLGGLGARQQVAAQEIRDRVRARFPALPALPERPRLDEILTAAGLSLAYDQHTRTYRSADAPSDTTGLATSPPSQEAPADEDAYVAGATAQRLRESRHARSFLALGVDAIRVDRAVDLLVRRHGAAVVDITRALIEALRERAAAAGVPWELVRAADAAAPDTRDAQGLAALVEQALPAVTEAIRAAEQGADPGDRPVLLTELAPLARYGHLGLLAGWADLATPRQQAVWAIVPQMLGNQGPLVDLRPLPLAAPGQYARVDAEWLATPLAGGAA